MTEAGAPERYAVVGHPIGHSRSPFIHTRFAEQTGEAIVYTAIDVDPGAFDEAVDRFRAGGGRGLNVTVPLKRQASAYATVLAPRAVRAGATNTLRFDDDGSVLGDNTDGPGLVRDLEHNLGFVLADTQVLLLGAGGAARGVLGPLLDRRPRALVVANRTAARAAELAARFADAGPIDGCGLDAIPARRFDLVVNATATGLDGARLPLAPAHVDAGTLCYDMMYGSRPTPFLAQGRDLGARRLVDGRGMLVEQAAESFFVWRGVRPATAPVIDALGRALAPA